jgi:hypothetical protein
VVEPLRHELYTIYNRTGNYFVCGAGNAGTAAAAAAAAARTLRLCDVWQALRIVIWCEFRVICPTLRDNETLKELLLYELYEHCLLILLSLCKSQLCISSCCCCCCRTSTTAAAATITTCGSSSS